VLLSLVDALRCPAAHAESPLVLSVEEWAGPRVSRGLLGCPVCHARYHIASGVADFTDGAGARQSPAADAPDVMRLAAQLSLAEPGGLVLLTGRYGEGHAALSGVADVTCLLVDAAGTMSPAAVNFDVAGRLPLVDDALRAAAVDEPRATPAFLSEVARCLGAGGRLVAPARAPIPPGVQLVAKDDREYVCEAVGHPLTVPLRRGPPR
jgi:hypothetical protein